jgi:antitoxin CcdA
MNTSDKLRLAIRGSACSIAEIADRAQISRTTLYSFVSGQTKQLRANAQAAVESALRASNTNVKEDGAQFDHQTAAEAKALGLDPDAIAQEAVEAAIKRKHMDAWIEENRSAMEKNAENIRRNGLWSDGLRLF